MIGNLSKVQERLKFYTVVPDNRFSVNSGLSPSEEAAKQKVRQYWADQDIPNVEKLAGLNLDLSGFDPRNTSHKELRSIAFILADLGIVDGGLIGSLSDMNIELDNAGNKINVDKRVNAYAFMDRSLEFLKKHISEGGDHAKGALIDMNTAITVLMALEERAKTPLVKSLVDIRA
ncbi:hypothetical protein [Pseudomonas sp. LP_7_YM]|uniref:hypothetical protein n=1 Tax=Pseudomonas sp. LP_7_YM TaxID=2485137 RepID=UPI00105F3DB1|nr:hypothetical protein [Pseudomonas sp. LP_7_YM]TDV69813.1 hypothetical protein EC915_10271 [Pseudomonas sp. LP_7_YM]